MLVYAMPPTENVPEKFHGLGEYPPYSSTIWFHSWKVSSSKFHPQNIPPKEIIMCTKSKRKSNMVVAITVHYNNSAVNGYRLEQLIAIFERDYKWKAEYTSGELSKNKSYGIPERRYHKMYIKSLKPPLHARF